MVYCLVAFFETYTLIKMTFWTPCPDIEKRLQFSKYFFCVYVSANTRCGFVYCSHLYVLHELCCVRFSGSPQWANPEIVGESWVSLHTVPCAIHQGRSKPLTQMQLLFKVAILANNTPIKMTFRYPDKVSKKSF